MDWIILLVLAVMLVSFFVLFILIQKGFRNPVATHTVPEEIPFEIQEVEYPTQKGKTIYAWWIPSDKKTTTVIFVHGWGRNAQRMMPYLRKFCCGKFNLLAFDARGHGNSDQDGYSNMLMFAEDIISSMNYVDNIQEAGNGEFYLIGLSIGGAASIYAAAHDSRIKKVLTVGAFAHPAAVITKQIKDRHIPYFPMIWFLYRYMKYIRKLDVDAMAPEKHIANAQAHFLLIHGEDDQTVPVEQGKRLKKAAGDKAELWVIPGKGHSNCHLEEGFWEKLMEFFDTSETKNQKH
ncbi:MAG: alpha/beta hydrolase [Bacteroidales bacterium]|nr:alpha/beta hydrolase [Bacteroidales bacterium]